MSVQQFVEHLRSIPAYASLAAALRGGARRIGLEGAPRAATAALAAGLLQDLKRTLVLVLPDLASAEAEVRRLLAFMGEEAAETLTQVALLPGDYAAVYHPVGMEAETVADRVVGLQRLRSGRPIVVVTTLEGLLSPCPPPGSLAERRELRVGQEVDREELLGWLTRMGYLREEVVGSPGQFGVRGGIVDVFPPDVEMPVRVEFFGDEVESLRAFEPATQRAVQEERRVAIGPAREIVPALSEGQREALWEEAQQQASELEGRGKGVQAEALLDRVAQELEMLAQGTYFAGAERYLRLLSPASTSVRYLPEGTCLWLVEVLRLESRWSEVREEVEAASRALLEEGEGLMAPPLPEEPWGLVGAGTVSCVSLGGMPSDWGSGALTIDMGGGVVESFGGHLDLLAGRLKEWGKAGSKVWIASKHASRTAELLLERGVKVGGAEVGEGARVIASPLHGGFTLGDGALVFLTDRELYGWERSLRPVPTFRRRTGAPVEAPLDIKAGDYVVHVNHGIGRYLGIERKTVDGVENEYLVVEYAAGDRLYVPATRTGRLQKYLGGEGAEPTLHRLIGRTWASARRKAQREVQELARQLLEAHAAREAVEGLRYSLDSPWMQEMEDAFPYEETPDQQAAIEAVKRDMESPKAMDRLVCGDVGFGKTEVAIRAAFKAALDGKQVAVLAPTTVLAQQHLGTFAERLEPFGVTVAMLSRFRTPKEQGEVVKGLASGKIDVVIGTHRLLAQDVEFKSLGVVVVDEEQRFGVRQKERLRQLKADVEVLTMSATPIPRTLHMALSGLRDLSMVNDPPAGRLAVRTFVVADSDEVIREAVTRELARGGQVFFVHNRIGTIEPQAERVARLVPRASIAVAHGQMAERELERIMLDFLHRRFDVLVCTTIIESGLDFPNVNTLIVREADRMGLAQLYQLRGRVGRSNRQAYAYILYQRSKRLTRDALERLEAIRDLTELGTGFRLALKDMEIRGTGNLLGAEQHGHIEAIGFELYCELLEQAVGALRGKPRPLPSELPTIDLPVAVTIPSEYVANETQRLSLYRRLGRAVSMEEVEELAAEMRDRYGPYPEVVENLLAVARLRLECLQRGIVSVEVARGIATLHADKRLAPPGKSAVHLHCSRQTGRNLIQRIASFVESLPLPTSD